MLRASHRIRALVLGAAVGALSSTLPVAVPIAHADAVPSPPASCPPGTRGGTNHVMQYCGPADCKSDADCGAGQECAYYPLCVSRLVSESPRGNSYSAPVSGPCKDGACEQGKCEAGNHCVPRGFAAPPRPPLTGEPSATPTTGASATPAASASAASGTPNATPPVRSSRGGCGCRTVAADEAGLTASLAFLACAALFGSRTFAARRRTRH